MRMRENEGSSRVMSRSLGRRLAKLACALAVSLSLAVSGVGCKSGGCSSCDLGNKLGSGVRATGATFRNLGAKVFHHKGGAAYGTSAAGCCGGEPGMVTEGGVEYNAMPMSPGTVVPGSSGILGEPLGPSMLEPAPKGKTVAPGETTGVNATGTNKSAYETATPRARGNSRSNNVALTPAPTNTAGGSQGLNPLDDLPPLEIPRPETSTLAAKPVVTEPLPPAATEGQPTVPAPDAKLNESLSPPPAPPTTTAPPATAHATPGSSALRLAVVEPGLAGGTVPNNEDLIRLVALGYKTIIDLRNPEEVHSSFIACASNHGLRYVGLPVTLETLDSTRINRFNLELAQTDARPIFFFDTAGSNAAALWAIRRQAIDKVDAQVARRDAEEIGTIDKSRQEAVAKYLGTIKPVAVIAEPMPQVKPIPTQAEVSTVVEFNTEPILVIPSLPKTAAAWRPYAVLILTSLGLPLAYWSRTASYGMFNPRAALASLPVRVRLLAALPHASGE